MVLANKEVPEGEVTNEVLVANKEGHEGDIHFKLQASTGVVV